MSVIIENQNRGHAIKQLQRGLKSVRRIDEYDTESFHDFIANATEVNISNVQTQAAIVNALIYVGDELSSLKKLLNEGVIDDYHDDGEGSREHMPSKHISDIPF